MGGITEELRWTAAKLMNVGKFAVDSAVNESLKGLTRGMQVYAIVKGKLKGQSPSDISNGDKKQNLVLVEEMQAKLDKMQEDMNNIQQQSTITTLRTEEQEPLKQFFDEPLKSSMPEVSGRRKIFIRSRL
ncbi:hypothetical protein DH2020_011677 [Rehmannia glutinosa]|uniref:Uncharacterized protein n=1 Tax=Rehmannia glutinosa TaxID=99300 RepID=A0ABR0XE27_REHGL